MAIPENDNQLWKGFDGHGLYSKRAERDVDGMVIDQTYAKKADVPALDTVLSDSSTTAITPKAVKDAIAAVDVIPELPQNPSSLYSETSGSMTWGGWETEELDIPDPSSVYIGGRTYPIVKIGSQLWLAENLDWKFDGLSVGDQGLPDTPAAWYYDNDENTYGINGNRYGLLYNWYAVNYLETNKASMLPAGWRVPTRNDIIACDDILPDSPNKLTHVLSQAWASGLNTTGMSLVPAGIRSYAEFNSIGIQKYIWTCETHEYYASSAYANYVYSDHANFYYADAPQKTWGCCVRLIKDV